MASQEQKIEHLSHHLPYEVLMLRHAHSRMNSPGYPLDWNAYYEAFALHARVLLDFLENKSDGRNFRKSDFSDTFKAETDQEIQRIVRQEMNCQVLHFGKSRKSEPSGGRAVRGNLARLFTYVTLLVFGAVTLAWWGVLAWLI